MTLTGRHRVQGVLSAGGRELRLATGNSRPVVEIHICTKRTRGDRPIPGSEDMFADVPVASYRRREVATAFLDPPKAIA